MKIADTTQAIMTAFFGSQHGFRSLVEKNSLAPEMVEILRNGGRKTCSEKRAFNPEGFSRYIESIGALTKSRYPT